MVGKAIYDRLTASGTQTQAICATRGYAQFNRDQTFPAWTWDVTSKEIDRHSTGRSGLIKYLVSVTAAALTYEGVVALAEAIKTDLDHQGGPAVTWGGINVLGAFLEDEDEDVTPLDNGADTPVYGKGMQFLIWTRD